MTEPHQRPHHRPHHFPPVPITPSTEPAKMSQVVSMDLPVDYRLLLLSLADQYVNEARAMSALLANGQPGADLHRHHKLIATALACYETVLQKYVSGLKPRQEALVQLRYAMLLYEEVENDHVTEAVLSKAIPFCQRNRLLDLKYTMQHLLARVLFKTKTKAALKYLDNAIQEATSCDHTIWVYALRFLRVSLSLQQHSSQEMHAAMAQLRVLSDLAKANGDRSVAAMAFVVQASVHLSYRDLESVNEAQRAIANARANVMSAGGQAPFQLEVILSMLDLVCSLEPYSQAQSRTKMLALQELLEGDDMSEKSNDGRFYVPLERTQTPMLANDTSGILNIDGQGRNSLAFTWLTERDGYLLAFFMCAATVYPKRVPTGEFIDGAFPMTTSNYSLQQPCKSDSLARACDRVRQRNTIRCFLFLYLALLKCNASAWTEAQSILRQFHSTVDVCGVDVSGHVRQFAAYLDGVVSHSLGHLDAALKFYASPLLSLSAPFDRTATHIQTYLSALATMNTLLIIGSPGHPLYSQIPVLQAKLSPHFPNIHGDAAKSTQPPTLLSQDRHLTTCYNLVLTHLNPSLLTKKQYLQSALNTAKITGNSQHMLLCLTYLYDFMFKGILGDQSMKSAKAAVVQAKEIDNATWNCVTNSQLADALELDGHAEQAKTMRRQAAAFAESLSPGLCQSLAEKAAASGVGQ